MNSSVKKNIEKLKTKQNELKLVSNADSIAHLPDEIEKVTLKIEEQLQLHLDEFILHFQEEANNKESEFIKLSCKILSYPTLKKINNELSPKYKLLINELLLRYKEQTLSLVEVNKLLFEIKKISIDSGKQIPSDTQRKINEADIVSIIDFLDEHPEYTRSVIENINKKKVKELFDKLEENEISQYIENLEKNNGEDLRDFIKEIDLYLNKKSSTPFKTSLKKAIVNLTSEKEELIYKQLAEKQEIQLIREVAIDNIPAFLITKLPREVIRNSLQGIDPDKIIKFLNTHEASTKATWLDLVADEGTKLREMIEMELSNSGDQNISNSQLIQLEFYKTFKKNYNKLDQSNETVTVIDQWLEKSS